MSDLRAQFSPDLKAAMKAKDACRVATLRLILATLKDRDIAARAEGNDEGIDDDQILDMLAKMVRQRRESVAIYRQGGRADLAEREAEEIAVIEGYMPKPLDEAETAQAIAEAIAAVDAHSLKDVGRVMAALKERYAGRMDFARAGALAKDRLAGKA